MPKQDLCRVPKYRAGGENHSAPLSCSPCPAVSSTFPFQRSKENRQFSLGLRTQGTLKQQVPRGQLQIFKLLLSPLVLKRASLSQWGGKWVPDPVNLAGWGALRQQWSPSPRWKLAYPPQPAPCTAYIHCPQNSISGGGSGGSSQLILRSFPQCVHSSLSLTVSRDLVLLPGPSALPPPSPLALPGPRTLWQRGRLPLLGPSCGPPPTSKLWLPHHSPPLWDRSTFCFKASLIFHFC